MEIQFTLDYNPFKTNLELFEAITSIVWNEFHGDALNITFIDNKISFTFKKGCWSDSCDFNKEIFRKECGKVSVRIMYGLLIKKVG